MSSYQVGYGSITLYGNKFGQNINKNDEKAPELVTFYGKLIHNTNPGHHKDTLSPLKRQDSKGNFKKKHQI